MLGAALSVAEGIEAIDTALSRTSTPTSTSNSTSTVTSVTSEAAGPASLSSGRRFRAVAVRDALSRLGTPQNRNSMSIGTHAGSTDLLPCLVAFGATVRIATHTQAENHRPGRARFISLARYMGVLDGKQPESGSSSTEGDGDRDGRDRKQDNLDQRLMLEIIIAGRCELWRAGGALELKSDPGTAGSGGDVSLLAGSASTDASSGAQVGIMAGTGGVAVTVQGRITNCQPNQAQHTLAPHSHELLGKRQLQPGKVDHGKGKPQPGFKGLLRDIGDGRGPGPRPLLLLRNCQEVR